MTCVPLLWLVAATGLWLNISTRRGLLTVMKTNKPLSSLTEGLEHEAHTGAVTPNLNTERNKDREEREKERERLAPYIPPRAPLPPSTCCYH